MTTLWNPRKPLNQPPHFRTGGPIAPGGSAPFHTYEQSKRAWVDANPAATPEQYETAIKAIAERLGV